jgi:excisionase family DNA binding protein
MTSDLEDPYVIDLLDIRQAATLLKVSETSLRRWTNAGTLPCLRIGGRRERRFRREDLLAFMATARRPAGTPATAAVANLEDVELNYGQHVCAFYESDPGFGKLAIPFLVEGLARDDRCFVVAGKQLWAELETALADNCADYLARRDAGQIVRRDASADPESVYSYFEDAFLKESQRGNTHLRVLGDMAAFLDAGASLTALIDFEQRYNQNLAHRFAVVSLCQYDARRFSGLGILGALKCHEDTLRYPLERFLGI